MRNKTRTFGILALSLALSACGINTPGTLEKVGQIVQVSKQGIASKTWEAEIVRGGFNGGQGVNGAAFYFTIESDSLAKVAQNLMESQREVKIHVRREGVYSITRSESGGDFATAIDTTPTRK